MTALLVATGNAHKVTEIAHMLGPSFRCFSLKDLASPPQIVEDGETFADNAAIKVRALMGCMLPTGEPDFILADDSGLEVDALQGAPGVHSARFAAIGEGNAPDADNNAKLMRLLQGIALPQRTARFKCVLALLPRGATEILFFEGACEGTIAAASSGKGGFGYDPLFIPDGYTESFALLGEEAKNKISHRANAMAKLKHFLKTNTAH